MNIISIRYFTKNSFSGGLIDFRAEFSTKPPISEYIIWNSKNIKVDGKTIYYPFYVEAGFLICKHMLLNMTNLESYILAKKKA